MSTAHAGPPVTVAITRHVPAGHEAEVVSWLTAGISLAERFPGFLGAGWVRPDVGSQDWHMLYRFADSSALEHWEHSPQRQWWRSSGSGLGVVESRVERRTGIEGWFDEPVETTVDQPAPAAPPRWKQATTIWLAFFPLSLLVGWVLSIVLPDLPIAPRVLLTTLLLTPVMTYVALPWITRRLAWWLAGEPAPWRRRARADSAS
ncbi:antibiotic biosynthesis monooxygenase [Nocardioides sp. CFH 31398]|uniref:antibiotic biosynthesis monooxygenase n=1 Tax=Nocardioides sp. CFH 31398 TaxID=2919579 RepID=UPI001F0509D4|nr:antibiotic biosynthesis monooxygenase [Nocardioides sp. CFH 31398]MCH1865102.1 antibiotic biosynthesis monooxygenase [Nocardioides sp. CFH 31398]